MGFLMLLFYNQNVQCHVYAKCASSYLKEKGNFYIICYMTLLQTIWPDCKVNSKITQSCKVGLTYINLGEMGIFNDYLYTKYPLSITY